MKLYDVIRKEDIDRGKPLPEIEPEVREVHERPRHRRPFGWKKVMVVGAAVLFVALLYIVGMKVVRAKVVITERQIPFSLDGVEFEVAHEGDTSVGRLSFQTMVVSTEVSRQVYGSDIQPSTSVAKGKVVFFNEHSTKPQTIKTKTTITAQNGKKYQTTEPVTVPGYTLKGKVKTPGTSAATAVVATAVGPTYNTTGTSFTVSGWSSKQVYAQSAGAITGGEDGVAHRVSAADQDSVIATLQAQLIERLKRETHAQIPDTLVTYPDLQVTTIDHDSLQLHGDSIKFPASIKGSMTTYLISRKELETAIATHVISDHPYPTVSIPALSSLTITAVTALPTDPKSTPDTIRIKVSGEGTIIAKAPLESIQQSLLGSAKRDFGSILGAVPEVDTAEYHLYPFWVPLFPDRSSRITVQLK